MITGTSRHIILSGAAQNKWGTASHVRLVIPDVSYSPPIPNGTVESDKTVKRTG